jgi:hypothetical protein
MRQKGTAFANHLSGNRPGTTFNDTLIASAGDATFRGGGFGAHDLIASQFRSGAGIATATLIFADIAIAF